MDHTPAPAADPRAKIIAATQRALDLSDPGADNPEADALWEALELALDELGIAYRDCTRCGSPPEAPDPTCGACPETDRVPCLIDNSCTYIAEDEGDLENHIAEQHPNTPECEECGTREDAELIHGKVLCPSCLHDAQRSGWTGNDDTEGN